MTDSDVVELFLVLALLSIQEWSAEHLGRPFDGSANPGAATVPQALFPGDEIEHTLPIGEEISEQELEDIASNVAQESTERATSPPGCPLVAPLQPKTFELTLRVREQSTASVGAPIQGFLPLNTLLKIRWHAGPWLDGGVRCELDPEESPREAFLSGYLSATLSSLCANLILGDFVVSSGMGLLLGGGARRRTDPAGTYAGMTHSKVQVRPAIPSEGSTFYRGVGFNCGRQWGPLWLQGSLFASMIDLRAGVGPDGAVQSLTSDFGEPSTRDQSRLVREQSAGFILRGRVSEEFSVGCSGTFSQYSVPLGAGWSTGGSGSRLSGIGCDAGIRLEKMSIAGEWCRGAAGDQDLSAALSFIAAGNGVLNVLYRDYAPGRICRHACRPGVRQTNGLEHGLQVSWSFPISGYVKTWGLLDRYRIALGSNETPPLGNGSEMLGVLRFSLPRNVTLQIQARRREREELSEYQDSLGRTVQMVFGRTQLWARGLLEFPLVQAVSVRARLDYTTVRCCPDGHRLHGESLSLEFRCALGKALTTAARIAVYGIESYESRLYDTGGSFPGETILYPLSGEGNRLTLILRWRILSDSFLYARYSLLARQADLMESGWRDPLDQRTISIQAAVQF